MNDLFNNVLYLHETNPMDFTYDNRLSLSLSLSLSLCVSVCVCVCVCVCVILAPNIGITNPEPSIMAFVQTCEIIFTNIVFLAMFDCIKLRFFNLNSRPSFLGKKMQLLP